MLCVRNSAGSFLRSIPPYICAPRSPIENAPARSIQPGSAAPIIAPAAAGSIEAPPEAIAREPNGEQDRTFDEQADIRRLRQIAEIEVGQGDDQANRTRQDEGVRVSPERERNEDSGQANDGQVGDPGFEHAPV